MAPESRLIEEVSGDTFHLFIKLGAPFFKEKVYPIRFSICTEIETCSSLHVRILDRFMMKDTVLLEISINTKDRFFVKNDKYTEKSQYVEKILTTADWEKFDEIRNNLVDGYRAKLKIKDKIYDFPMAREIEISSVLVPYHQIYTYSEHPMEILSLQEEGYDILLGDFYCLKKNCNCSDAKIVFLKNKDGTLESSGASGLSINYKKGEIEAAVSIERGDADYARDLWGKFKTKYPQFEKTLAKRHKKIKADYSSYKKRNPNFMDEKEVRFKKTVGRNAPCPCGSGKKYKRCCDLTK